MNQKIMNSLKARLKLEYTSVEERVIEQAAEESMRTCIPPIITMPIGDLRDMLLLEVARRILNKNYKSILPKKLSKEQLIKRLKELYPNASEGQIDSAVCIAIVDVELFPLSGRGIDTLQAAKKLLDEL